jgi:hypothetical protein
VLHILDDDHAKKKEKPYYSPEFKRKDTILLGNKSK